MAKTRLLFVHGRAQQGKSEQGVTDEWLSALRRGLGESANILDDVEVRAPFYGDELIRLVNSVGDAIPEDIIVRGDPSGIDNQYRRFLADQLELIRQSEGVTDEQVAAETDGVVTERGPQNWPWVLAIVKVLNRIPGLDGDMIERFLRDVWIYLERRTVRRTINAIVAPAFESAGPIICVAHSLGTIIAYDILREGATGSVPQLITLGSPLGLDISRRALAPLKHPSKVGDWFNARDTRDVVALYPLDSGHFSIDPPITDFSGVRNRTPNAHGISGYLDDAQVAGRIKAAIERAG
jgi:hypothetical protein